MENESMTLPSELLKRFKTGETFIETGAYDGRAVQQALDCGFENALSVEVSGKYWAMCTERFLGNPHVRVALGDSLEHLPRFVAEQEDIATIWLDSHVQEGWQGKVAVPLLQELDIIAKHSFRRDHTILIDDRRLMGSSAPGWAEVTEKAVVEALLRINPAYTIVYADNKVTMYDIIVAFVEAE